MNLLESSLLLLVTKINKKKVLKQKSEIFATQFRKKRCEKISALWTFQYNFMPPLSYSMVVTQLSENEWKQIISPAARATMNSASMVRNMPHAIFYGPENYQGLKFYHPYFLQEITHIMILVQESVSQSQTGILLRVCAEAFRVKLEFCSLYPTQNMIKRLLGICPWLLAQKPLEIYVTLRIQFFSGHCWRLWRRAPAKATQFISDASFLKEKKRKEKKRKEKKRKEKNGYKQEDLKLLNFIQKHLCMFTLEDIATVDSKKISP